MARRYLFGPVDGAFADQHLHRHRQDGSCLTFHDAPGADLVFRPGDSWQSLCDRLPPDWRPDFVALWLPYARVPAAVWSAPVPLVGLAADANLLWHFYRLRLPSCELVLADAPTVDALTRAGFGQARAANLFGLARAFLEEPWPEAPRNIDVLFVGNTHPAVQRRRLPWLGRLARLADRWRVVIDAGVFGADYRRLLGRARVVFNHSVRGECNQRALEAAAAGALLFQEADNREVGNLFRDRQECVLYTEDNWEELLEHYLGHEGQRAALAAAARARVAPYGFATLWEQHLEMIDREWPAINERVARRPGLRNGEDLLARTWEAIGCGGADSSLARDLAAALAAEPRSAALHNALGVAEALTGDGRAPLTAERSAQAAGHFRRAVACEPGHVLARLNLAEALWGAGRTPEALDQARQALAVLDRAAGRGALPAWSQEAHFPPGFDFFGVEWQRAGWDHAGSPAAEGRAKVALLRWRLHALLAEATGDLAHAYEAALARPDLGLTRTTLDAALARAGRPALGLPHLHAAVTADPFDLTAARVLHRALGEAGDVEGQRRLARDRCLLSKAAPRLVPAEPWFQDAPPLGDELASIIVLCCNEVEYTRHCLESVLRQTRTLYELILVDNGSTDGTPAYLADVQRRPGPERVVVLRNEQNVGFPAGCNQGLAEARGRYVVLLNNDTVVTAGWLDGLVAAVLHEWPSVGMAGAVTNYGRAPQQVPCGYAGLDGVDAFAARRRREFAGQALRVERLTGFCLLARRDVLHRVGGLDEGYGAGFFEDDDLCVRVRQAGFQLLVALDVFVHHFGSRTFTALGIDCARQLDENFARFQAKWGPEHSAGYRLPAAAGPEPGTHSAAPTAPAAAARPRVSLCLIVKNEEDNLPACLASAAGLFDEVIVVDTGSTDRTREVAIGLGARVFDFAWVDDFAAARNESLRHATGDWVFWLDADDRLDEANREKLRALFARLGDEDAAYVMKCLCLPEPGGTTATAVDHVRLFRNRPDLRWEYRVHEQILGAVRRSGGTVRWSDVVIRHTGYQDAALRRRKLERDLRLLRLQDADRPDDPFTLFNLGSVYQELGRPGEAIPLLQRSLERSDPADSIVRKLYALLAHCHRRLGERAAAAAACRAGRRLYPDDAELLFQETDLSAEAGDADGAEACLLRLLHGKEGAHFASVDAGLRGFKARYKLALLYERQGRRAEAEAQWRAALAETPGFLPGWLALGDLLLEQGRWSEAEEVARQLEGEGRSPAEAAVLRARGHLARREFTAARSLLEAAVAAAPQALRPRVALTHVLLQEGTDLTAAEKALRAVLALDPHHEEARHNLEVFRRRHGQAAMPPAAGVETT
jgi:GT2 family glycosyltransferase/predicted Zn-dependent protease